VQPERFPGDFPGTIKVPPSLPRLVAAADLVCLGRVVGLHEEGEAEYLVGETARRFRRMAASVAVERVYAGDVRPGPIDVELLVPELPSALARLDEGERAVLFLERRGAHHRLVDVSTAKIPAERTDEQALRALAEARDGPDEAVARIAGAILADLERA
jgi:hypothetical protein